MTPESLFLQYIGDDCRNPGLAQWQIKRIASARYHAYVEAFRCQTFSEWVYAGRLAGANLPAVLAAARDRDRGRTMYEAPELGQEGSHHAA